MKMLLFINKNFKLNQIEVEKFINCLLLNEVLEEHLQFISEKVNLNELLSFIDQRYLINKDERIMYRNLFTSEEFIFYQNKGKIFIFGIEDDNSLKYIFYRISDNYVLIDYWKNYLLLLII